MLIGFAGPWLTLLLVAVLALPFAAQADELSDAQAELDSATAELQTITAQVGESGDAVAALADEIDGLAADIEARQAQRGRLQQHIFDISRAIYKSGDELNIAMIITESESLSDVLERMEVRSKVLGEYARLAEEQERAGAELVIAYQKVSAQKDEQAAKLAELESRQSELDGAVSSLQARVDELDAAQRAALAEAQEAERRAAEAAEAAKQPETPAPEPEPEPATETEAESEPEPEPEKPAPDDADKQEKAKEEQAAEPDPKPEPEPEPEPEPAQADVASGWQTGIASAYGGSSDPSTGAVATTATGATCDDWSMGVAVPMVWGPQDYYGRSVEISYGGTTVVATVNDCGGMGGGARSLDLQPGVWKAFGFKSCNDWGIREVQYRFL